MTLFLNIDMPLDLRNYLGWILMGFAGLNIFVNLCITCYDSLKDMWDGRKRRKYTKSAEKALKAKLENRERLIKQFPG